MFGPGGFTVLMLPPQKLHECQGAKQRPARCMLSQATSVDAWQEPLWHAFVARGRRVFVVGSNEFLETLPC